METKLFFPGQALLPEKDLRALARKEVLNSQLISLCRKGNYDAITALLVGYWPFVKPFEDLIDERGPELLGSRHQLSKMFPNTREVLSSVAKAVKVMKREEGSHAKIWLADAEGADVGDLKREEVAMGVKELVESARTSPLWKHYCVLAGTEYIAEELSRVLSLESPEFIRHFEDDRFRWGEVHLADNHNGPSHREIDEDIARALYLAEHPNAHEPEVYHDLYMGVHGAIRLFGKASHDVYELFGVPAPDLRVAAT